MNTRTKTTLMLLFATTLLFAACKKDDSSTQSPGPITNATFNFDGQAVQLRSLTTKVKQFTTDYGINGHRLIIDAVANEKPAGCTMYMPTFHIVIERVGGDATWRIIGDSTYAYTADMLANETQRNYFTVPVDAQTVRPVKPNYIHYSSSQYTDNPVNGDNNTVSINCQITFQGVYEKETTRTYNPQDLKGLSVMIRENPYTEI